MSTNFKLLTAPRRPQFGPEEIAAGLQRPRFKPPSTQWNPLPHLERLPGWWQGATNARVQFRAEDLGRLERVRGMATDATEPLEGATPDVHRQRDAAFSRAWTIHVLRGHVADHERAIEKYQRKMAGVLMRVEE